MHMHQSVHIDYNCLKAYNLYIYIYIYAVIMMHHICLSGTYSMYVHTTCEIRHPDMHAYTIGIRSLFDHS